MINEIVQLKNKLKSLINEATRAPHPEDYVLTSGTQGAKQAIDYLSSIAENPSETTIKWDGYPALIFGRGPDGKFTIVDKHMFDKKDGSGRQIYSPNDFIKYDQARGVDRGELNNVIQTLWPALEKQTRGSEGYYWGDLLFGKALAPKSGKYVFKANPNGLTYKIDANSEIGKLLQNKIAGIAVHTYIPPDAVSTSQAQSLNGGLGSLSNNGSVALLPARVSTTPKVKLDTSLVKKIENEINSNGQLIDDFYSNSPVAKSTLSNFFTTYINKRVRQGSLKDLYKNFIIELAATPMTTSMRQKINTYFKEHEKAIKAIFQIWADLYNLKIKVKNYFDEVEKTSPIQAYNDEGKKMGHEGYFFRGGKLVDRLGFTHNLFKNQ